jgi:hypothetical protein
VHLFQHISISDGVMINIKARVKNTECAFEINENNCSVQFIITPSEICFREKVPVNSPAVLSFSFRVFRNEEKASS